MDRPERKHVYRDMIYDSTRRDGEWRDVLSAESLAPYERLATRRLSPELKTWLEHGRAGADPKAA